MPAVTASRKVRKCGAVTVQYKKAHRSAHKAIAQLRRAKRAAANAVRNAKRSFKVLKQAIQVRKTPKFQAQAKKHTQLVKKLVIRKKALKLKLSTNFKKFIKGMPKKQVKKEIKAKRTWNGLQKAKANLAVRDAYCVFLL
jgi:hypothetical protein